nr:hypothetical protein [bacterium]
MKKESLQIIRNKIIDILEEADINPVDKGELAINLYHFLDGDSYESNIKALRNSEKEERQISIEEYVKTLRKGNKNDRGNN